MFRLADDMPERLLHDEVMPTCVGHIVGLRAGTDVPVIVGLPAETGEDRLKALGAAAASSGAVSMFHAVGITPEAPTLDDALGGNAVTREVVVTRDRVRAARDELTTVADGPIAAVSVGTPHLSSTELARLAAPSATIRRRSRCTRTPAGTSPSRRARSRTLAEAGVTVVSDTCTYITPILHDIDGPVMTNSAKWAWYAPANLGFDVVFGSWTSASAPRRSAACGATRTCGATSDA